jgi:hypothetical protein
MSPSLKSFSDASMAAGSSSGVRSSSTVWTALPSVSMFDQLLFFAREAAARVEGIEPCRFLAG